MYSDTFRIYFKMNAHKFIMDIKLFTFFRPVNDTETCWHGSGVYEDCNNKLWTRNLMIRYYGKQCKWWHFYPDETVADLEAKFKEIMADNAEKDILTNLVGNAKSFKKSFAERLFG